MIESPWTFAGQSSSSGGTDSVTLDDGTTFLVCARSGAIGQGASGLFMFDIRVISVWQLRVNGRPVQALSVIPNGPFSATFAGRIDDPSSADAPLTVVQRRHLGRGMREDLDVRNHGGTRLSVRLEVRVASDFASLFDVKAGGEPKTPTANGNPSPWAT